MSAAQGQNVQVVVRCRPLSQAEIQEKLPPVAKVDEDTKEVTIDVKSRGLTKTFTYDAVYGPSASQRDVYNGTVLPIVQEVLDGYNCTIFAYGQTGTGKTYTMEGNRDTEDTSQLDSKARLKAAREAGIISRAINTIFEHLSKSSDEYTVKVSHLELYNEELYDLLDPDNKGLKILEDPTNPNSSITIRGLTEINVYNPRDIFNVLEKSWMERTTAETLLNKESSRSHCIFSVTIHMKERNMDGEDLLKVGKLNLVDLAGSENVGKSGMATKTTGRQEAGMINKSLLAFGRVITALVDQAPHIPYRESKLTRLLQDSLGGKTKTCIVATISPASVSLDETIGTLEYAHRAKSIKNQPQVNAKLSKKEFLGDYAKEIDDVRVQLDCMRRRDGVHISHEDYQRLSDDLRTKTEEIEILLEEKLVKQKEFEEIHEVFDAQFTQLKEAKSTLQMTQATLESTIQELNDTLRTLEATRNELLEQKVVLSERAQTEAKFHQEASVVLSTLSESLHDIEALHAKITRQEELGAHNSAAWFDLRDDLVLRVKKSEEQVHAFISAQDTQFATLDTFIKSLVSSKELEVSNVLSRIRNLTALVEGNQKKVVNMVNAQFEDSKRQSAALRAVEVGHSELMQKQLGTMAEVIDGRVGTLMTTISSYDQRTKAWSEARENELKEAVVATHQFTESHKDAVAKLRSETNSQIEKEIASYGGSRLKLASFMEQQKADARDFQSKLLASLSVMLADFVSKKETTIDSAVQAFSKNFDSRVDDLVSFRSVADASYNAMTEQTGTYSRDSAAKKVAMIESIKKMSEITSGISKINTDQARQINSAATSEIAKIKESQNTHLKAIDTQLSEALLILENSSEAERSSLLELVAQTNAAAETLSNSIASDLNSFKSASESWAQELKARSADGSAFEATLAKASAELSSQMTGFELQKYSPVGTSPSKKVWSYPTELARTRPEAEIIAQFRNGGEPVTIVDPLVEARKAAEAALKSLKETKEAEVASDLSFEGADAIDSVASEDIKSTENKPSALAAVGMQKPKVVKPLTQNNQTAVPRAGTGINKAALPTASTLSKTMSVNKIPLANRENPKTTQPQQAQSTVAPTNNKPMLKRTNSQQQLVTAVVRKPQEPNKVQQ